MIELLKTLLNFIFACFLLFLVACGTTRSLPYLQQTSVLPAKNICNIAVLPFLNESQYKQGGFIGYRVFMAELTRFGMYNVVQEGDIREVYRQMKIFPNRLPGHEELAILGNRLDSEILVTGRIIEMTEDFIGREMNPSLAIILQIHDSRTGRVLWTTYHKRQGTDFRTVMHFGKINTITSLAKQVSHEVLTLWKERGLQGCEN